MRLPLFFESAKMNVFCELILDIQLYQKILRSLLVRSIQLFICLDFFECNESIYGKKKHFISIETSETFLNIKEILVLRPWEKSETSLFQTVASYGFSLAKIVFCHNLLPHDQVSNEKKCRIILKTVHG